jgi:hypothetical protein
VSLVHSAEISIRACGEVGWSDNEVPTSAAVFRLKTGEMAQHWIFSSARGSCGPLWSMTGWLAKLR